MGANIANPTHLLLIVVVLVLVFGAKKLPELGRGIGQGLREFKSGISGQDDRSAAQAAPVLAQTATPEHDATGRREIA